MNSLLAVLLTKVVRESGNLCGIDTTQDIKTILSRVEHEGVSFMTITLPTFSKDLQRALDRGYVAEDLFRPFNRSKSSKLPKFLGGFLRLVFDEGDGRILDSVDCLEAIDAIRSMLQISGLLKKVELDCTDARINAALLRYIENDAYVLRHRETVTPDMYRKFIHMAHVLFGDVFSSVQSEIDNEELRPIHGPGATADKLVGNNKFIPELQTWPSRLERYFPQGRYGYSSYSIYCDEVLEGKAVPGTEIPVRVITVPKTLSTPRIIAIEPTVMQYAQQALHDSFFRAVDRSPVGSVMSWRSQVPNQELALQGSIPMHYVSTKKHTHVGFATLDLSDASDMVDNQLVKALFKNFPILDGAVQDMRTRRADVLGQTIRLNKFASMGSALCFPIESIVFTTLVFLGIHEVYPTVRPQNLLKEFSGLVRVYGDDIIVPVRAARSVVQTLQAFGLRVNDTKSFWTGMFRESCGKEYFAGVDVTIAKTIHELPSTRKPIAGQEQEIVSTVALRNNLFSRGYHETAFWLDTILEKVLHGHYPIVLATSPILGRVQFGEFAIHTMDKNTQTPLVKGYRVKSRIPSSKLDGYGALVKTLGKRSELPIFDPRHLQQAGRPRALRIKLGYSRPY
jgi:hypothetical protein